MVKALLNGLINYLWVSDPLANIRDLEVPLNACSLNDGYAKYFIQPPVAGIEVPVIDLKMIKFKLVSINRPETIYLGDGRIFVREDLLKIDSFMEHISLIAEQSKSKLEKLLG